METTKIQVKIQQDEDNVTWVHFCYVPSELKQRFDKEVNLHKLTCSYWLAKWAFVDFGLLDVDTVDGLANLKQSIRDVYKTRYPELETKGQTDYHGWLRVWYVGNMEKELREIGK